MAGCFKIIPVDLVVGSEAASPRFASHTQIYSGIIYISSSVAINSLVVEARLRLFDHQRIIAYELLVGSVLYVGVGREERSGFAALRFSTTTPTYST
jgi:hypothetical protein